VSVNSIAATKRARVILGLLMGYDTGVNAGSAPNPNSLVNA